MSDHGGHAGGETHSHKESSGQVIPSIKNAFAEALNATLENVIVEPMAKLGLDVVEGVGQVVDQAARFGHQKTKGSGGGHGGGGGSHAKAH